MTKPKPKTTPSTKPRATKTTKAVKDAQADDDTMTARAMSDGTCNSLVTLAYLPNVNGGSTVQALADCGHSQARAVTAGDLSSLEHMLLTQATALQAMFTDLACRAKRQISVDLTQTLTTLALKSAAGSRQAIVALAELRAPKSVMFAQQANISSGPQQVNNGAAAPVPARAEENQNRPNELLEDIPHEYLDTRAASGGIGTHQGRAALEPVHRATDA